MREAIEFLGVRMHPWTMAETVDEILRRLDAGEFTHHVVVNVAKLVAARSQPALREAIESCDIINIDGMGVVWGARSAGHRVPERVAGVDLFHELLRAFERTGHSVFLLGATEAVLERCEQTLRAAYPALRIVGSHHGYFDRGDATVPAMIERSGADALFVGISSPHKERFLHRWRDRLGVGFAMGVGGTFDVVAGETARAPLWMQRAGLEWLFRLVQEPRRMWRRYLVSNGSFAWLLALELMRTRVR